MSAPDAVKPYTREELDRFDGSFLANHPSKLRWLDKAGLDIVRLLATARAGLEWKAFLVAARPAPDSPSGRPMLREATDAYYNCDCSSEKCEHFRAMEVALNAGATQAGTSPEVPALRLRGDILSSMDELESQARQLGETAYDRGARASIRSYINELRGQITADLNALVACARGNAGEVSRRERPQDQSDDRRALAVPTREALVAAFEDVADNHTLVARATYPHQGQDEVRAAKRRLGDAIGTRDTLLDALYAALSAAREDRDAWKNAHAEAVGHMERWVEREAACCPEDVPFDEYIKGLQKALSAAQRDTERLRTALQRLVDTEMDESGGNYDGAAKLRDAVYDAMEVLGPRLTPSEHRPSSETK